MRPLLMRCTAAALATALTVLPGCGGGSSAGEAPPSGGQRLALCSGDPLRLDSPPGAVQSGGCVVRYTQHSTDAATIARFGRSDFQRRYLVYVPRNLPARAVPVVFVFPGAGTNAEAAAYYYTQTRFERLAERDGFVVVYGNGLPFVPDNMNNGSAAPMAEAGYFQGCLIEHAGEGIDVQYVREILAQLDATPEVSVDPKRVYATGLSAGGGLAFELVIEAPDLVAAVAPVAGLPFQPGGEWQMHCNLHPNHGQVSIAMLAATADPWISYAPGASLVFPDAHYPGMEATRDAWRAAMGIAAAAQTSSFPDVVTSDAYAPQAGMTSSQIELSKYAAGTAGAELWYYKAVGAGHWWPNPSQIIASLWPTFGKTNQDIDFADEAWGFFQRHAKP
jgi:polyhydroxybutyrate depolymerase